MYNRRLLPKVFLSIVLAITMVFPSVTPVLGLKPVIEAKAENESDSILQTAYVRLNDLGFANYLSIVLAQGVEFDQCIFEVDGERIFPTKVSDTGSVSKWELFDYSNRALTVHYQGGSRTVVFNESGVGMKPQTYSGTVQPKWIWSSGTANFFDYHISSYDASGNEMKSPSKTTFDVLNSTVKEKEEVAYFVKEAILEEPYKGGPALEIKFQLKTDEAKSWFSGINYVARMANPSQSKGLDEQLSFDPKLEVKFSHGSNVGFLKINPGQIPLRHTGMNYIRIISGTDAVVIPVEIIDAKAPTLTFTGTVTNPRVGEDFKFRINGANQGLVLQNDFIKVAKLKRPIADGSRVQETVNLKFGEIGLIGYLLNIDGKMLDKAGWYELELRFAGYKPVKKVFEILPAKKLPNTQQNNNSNTSGDNAASSSTTPGTASGTTSENSSNANSSASSGSSAGSSYSGGGFAGGSSVSTGNPGTGIATASATVGEENKEKLNTAPEDTKKEAEVTIQENETPMTYAPVKTSKVKVVRSASEKSMKKAVVKDVKKVFGDDSNIRLQDLLIYFYKADSRKNQKLAEKLSQKELDKKVLAHMIKLGILDKKAMSRTALNKQLSKKEVQKLLEKFVKAKANKKTTLNKATKIHALGGASVVPKINIGKGDSSSSDGADASVGTLSIQAECIFDYDMLVNALLLKELGLGNMYSDKIADLFETGLTEHRAIFDEGSKLYDFGKYVDFYKQQKYENIYVNYNRYTRLATGEDMLPGSAYQLRVVLDNGSLGGHLFGGMSGNPDIFGGKLPEITSVTIRRGEDLSFDLKDETFVSNIKIPQGLMVNREYYSTDNYGIGLNGTRITMPAGEISRLLAKPEGGNSFYINIKADKYNAMKVQVTVID